MFKEYRFRYTTSYFVGYILKCTTRGTLLALELLSSIIKIVSPLRKLTVVCMTSLIHNKMLSIYWLLLWYFIVYYYYNCCDFCVLEARNYLPFKFARSGLLHENLLWRKILLLFCIFSHRLVFAVDQWIKCTLLIDAL